MFCPFCRHEDTKVSDSRAADDGASIRRRRSCPQCERKFTTIEQIILTVVKRSGVVEPFSREKVIKGVGKACQGRPVTQSQLAALGQRVEEALRSSGQAEIPAEEIGLAILQPLAELDSVAYLRFASVYQKYDSLEDFAAEIERLQGNRPKKNKRTEKPSGQEPSGEEPPGQEPLIG